MPLEIYIYIYCLYKLYDYLLQVCLTVSLSAEMGIVLIVIWSVTELIIAPTTLMKMCAVSKL